MRDPLKIKNFLIAVKSNNIDEVTRYLEKDPALALVGDSVSISDNINS